MFKKIWECITWKNIEKTALIIALLGFLITVINITLSVGPFIDLRVKNAISNEKFIRKLSKRIRPYAIFNENSSILHDSGAMEFIDDISVKTSYDENGFGTLVIKIKPNRFFSFPPTIETFGPWGLEIKAKRGKKFNWIYDCSIFSSQNSPDHKNDPIQFRIEINH